MKNLLLIMFIVIGAYSAHHFGRPDTIGNKSAEFSAEKIHSLAAAVQPQDIIMYSTNECQYCVEAKGWLTQNGFQYTECNMSTTQHCIDEFKAYGASGTPYLVIRANGKTHYMKNGFDSDEFLQALQS